MDTNRRTELFETLEYRAFAPPVARAQVARSLGGQPVIAFVVLSSVHVGADADLDAYVRVGIVTATRFIHVLWYEDSDIDEDDMLAAAGSGVEAVEEFLANAALDNAGGIPDPVAADPLTAASPQPGPPLRGRLVIHARTVSLSHVTDVQTSQHFKPAAPGCEPELDGAQVLVTSPTLDTLTIEDATCANPECGGEHGYAAAAEHDAIEFSATVVHDGTDTVEAVLDFAAALDNVIGR